MQKPQKTDTQQPGLAIRQTYHKSTQFTFQMLTKNYDIMTSRKYSTVNIKTQSMSTKSANILLLACSQFFKV